MNDEPDTPVTRPLEPVRDDPTVVMPPPDPQGSPSPGRGGFLAGVRRRWQTIVVTAVLVIGAALGGVAVGHAIWAPGEQSTVQEYAQEPQSGGQLPFDGDAPDGSGSEYGQPYGGSGSNGSSGSDSTTAQGPSASEVAAIAAKVSPGVVNVNVTLAYGGGQGAGTGMVLTSSGLVLTNNHVIDGVGEISVTTVDRKTYSATVLGYDTSHDIALLQLEDASGLETVAIGDSASVTVGDKIVVLGNAGGDGGQPTASGGSVAALDQQIVATGSSGSEQLSGLIQVSADVRSGQSGGPVVNADGEVVGVITAASSGYSFDEAGGTGYAVPVDQAMAIARQIEDGQSSGTVHVGATAFLGVRVSSASGDVIPGYGSGYGDGAGGAFVAGVLPDTPAEKAGLQSGDTITSIDGKSVDSADSLSRMLSECAPGDEVQVVWIDQAGEEHSATVTLMEGPPA